MRQKKSISITKQYLRSQYRPAMLLIVLIALVSSILSLNISKRYQVVASNIQTINRFSVSAIETFNKVQQLIGMETSERGSYATSARIAINQMSKSFDKLNASAAMHGFSHLDLLKDPSVNGSAVLLSIIAQSQKIVEKASVGLSFENDLLRYNTLTTTQFSHIIERLINDAVNKQEDLSDWLLYASVLASVAVTVIVLLIVLFVFAPMENEIIVANELLEQEKEKVEAANEIHEYHANHDALTGLANLRQYNGELQRRSELKFTEHTLALIDLDHFKSINDKNGHEAGDFVLKNVAAILLRYAQKGDLAIRIGGDEFAILFAPNTKLENAKRVCHALVKEIGEEQLFKTSKLKVGASIGLSSTQIRTVEFSSLFKSADDALYKSKSAGRNCLTVYSAEHTGKSAMPKTAVA